MGDSTAPEVEGNSTIEADERKEAIDQCEEIVPPFRDVRIVSLEDKITVEKIVLEGYGSSEVLLTRTETSRKISSSPERKNELQATGTKLISKKSEERTIQKSEKSKTTSKTSDLNGLAGSKTKLNQVLKSSQLPVLKAKKSGSVSSLIEKRISPVKLTKSSSITSINKEIKSARPSSSVKPSKIPPKVPAKPKVKKQEFSVSSKASLRCTSAPTSPAVKITPQIKNHPNGSIVKEKARNVDTLISVPFAFRDSDNPSVSKKSEVQKPFKLRATSSLESNHSAITDPISEGDKVETSDARAANSAAQTHLQKSQSKIEELQRGLQTKINAATVESYKQRLAESQSAGLKGRLVKSLDLNENVTREKFDKEFLKKHNFDKQLKIEEKRVLETDIDYVSDSEKTETTSHDPKKIDVVIEKRKYSKSVSEIEKRWSGEFLEGHLDQNSSESSKSSYVEELGSISSHEDVAIDNNALFIEEIRKRSEELPSGRSKLSVKSNPEEILHDTVSTVGSNFCIEERIKDVDAEVEVLITNNEESNESKESTLKESSSSTVTIEHHSSPTRDSDNKDSENLTENASKGQILEHSNHSENINNNQSLTYSDDVDNNNVETKLNPQVNEILDAVVTDDVEIRVQSVKVPEDSASPGHPPSVKDGYADLIKAFTMEAGPSKVPKEEKKRKGFRRLLPGLFSPKDSRKDYKKEQKERKKREEKQFGQYQQNGNYTRSPDTMNLNEDIKRNVKLNPSLNSSIIEERLNEIKQELFPDQGLTTSTPDHFLQEERTGLRPSSRSQRFYTGNSSLSSIAPDDKWVDHNIISGSPNIRKFKQRKSEADQKYSLERKHSLQEPVSQGRFFRNHGPSGRTSAPPGERFLIRPRAVHPVDRPLPAIPQKVEFSNYENNREALKYTGQNPDASKYPQATYPRQAQDYQENSGQIYEDRNNLENFEQTRNHSIDSGFNLTPVSAQVKITRQPVINQNQKAPLIGRSPKYSPSSSQKSGDYADSNYTPNSSQKSEFSPSSSKSGEYYLNSPWTSVQTSPNDSLTDKREQIYENNRQSPKTPYPISPNVKVQGGDDPLYGVTPRSSERAMSPVIYNDPPITPRKLKSGPLTVLPLHASHDTPEPVYVQRNPSRDPQSANIELREKLNENSLQSLNSAMEDRPNSPPRVYLDGSLSLGSSVGPERRLDFDARQNSPARSTDNSPGNRVRALSPDNRSHSSISPQTTTHVRRSQRPPVSSVQRIASPLTVLPLENSSPSVSSTPPVIRARNSVSPLARPMSPGEGTPVRVPEQFRTPMTSPKMNDARQRTPVSGPYVPMSSRRSCQPSEQILIASPKRDEPQLRRPTNTRLTDYPASPVPMTDSPNIVIQAPVTTDANFGNRTLSPRPTPNDKQARGTDGQSTVGIQRPEPIYGQRTISPLHRNQDQVYERRAISPPRNPDVYGNPGVCGSTSPSRTSRQEERSEQSAAPRKQQAEYSSRSDVSLSESQQSIYSAKQPAHSEQIYSQGPSRQPSPTKRQTMQHLEAFYWQQKALEMQRKTNASPSNSSARNSEPRIDHPEIREAMYWQQLKKLDEEQQRRIYQENVVRDERSDPLYWRRKLQSPPRSPATVGPTSRHGSSPNLQNQSAQTSPGDQNTENFYWRSKLQQPKVPVTNKPPIMGQKGQNQPVLVVRPQPVYQEKEFDNREIHATHRSDPKRHPPPRSKSASPLFARGEERRSLSLPRKSEGESDDGGFLRGVRERSSVAALRKASTPPIYEENHQDSDKKPPPIFKRGSLISNSSNSVDYGTGQKRVSFSNQINNADVGNGIWPTKHGMAPEPPTRQRRVDRVSTNSESDSVFLHDEENQNNSNANVYGNVVARSVSQTRETTSPTVTPAFGGYTGEQYDADRPLPPPPREPLRFLRRSNSVRDQSKESTKVDGDQNTRGKYSNSNPRRWPPALSESESGSEAGEIQRILRKRNEEEWNPDGKGRQSNETGGTGRGEGEGGTGDLPGGGGRRIGVAGTGGGGGRSRDEPRRHTLSGDHQPSLHHQQFNSQLHPLHPHHLPPPHGQYGATSNRHATTMDLEMGTKSRRGKTTLPRGYPPPSSAMLFDDDPGIMSEVETSSTGFRRGGKQRSSLPVVRTPSKTLERPLGLVFLQYRNETKRALLPNEITSIDTVKALFVRSFPKQLTMEYLDSPLVKVYIHDSNKDMFYELEDMRSHLRDIRDRSVLRLFESSDGVAGMPGPLGAPGGGGGLPPHWEDQSYFSEPEFDSEYQHQHVHKSKTAKNSTSGSGGYYMGGSSTLPRGGPVLRAYSPASSSAVSGPNANSTQSKTLGTPGGGGVPPAKPLRSYQCGKTPLGNLGGSARFSRDSSVSLYSIPDRLHGESGYMSSPERSSGVGAGSGRYPAGPYSTGSSYEDPYYSQYSGTVTPVIDEEASDTELLEESYSLYGVKPPGRPPTGPPRSPFPPGAPALTPGGQPYDVTRIRVEHMERQLANLTGLVQKALTHAPHASPSPRDYLQVPAPRDPYRTSGAGDEFDKHSSSSSASLPDDSYLRTDVKPPKLGKDKSVSFEKSVSFSDEPPDMNSPKQHSPQHAADTKPTKPAIKSSTLPRMSSQERERHKPTPPPKPATLAAGQYVYKDLTLTPEMYNQLRGLQKKAKDLRQEMRNLRRMSQAQAHTVRETIRDTFITIRALLLSGGDAAWAAGDTEKVRLNREEDLYKQEMIRLEKDLTELESTVEELRGNVINRKTRVNMSDVENMALILSKSSKTVADLKVRFPSLQEGMKGLLSSEMEKVVREEKFLKEEPERLESALRRLKKLTSTLVTLKRLASVQEQRLPNAPSVDAEETPPITPTSGQPSKTAPAPAERTAVGSTGFVGGGSNTLDSYQRAENALDVLLGELQTFSRPASQLSQTSSISYPPNLAEIGRSASQVSQMSHAPSMSDIGRKGSIDSSTNLAIATTPGHTSTLRRLHSYPSSSDTDTSPPIARLQVSDISTPPQKPPVPERNAELLQLATARRVPPPPPPRTSSRSPLASPTSPQLPPRNPTGTLRRGRSNLKDSGKPPMALPATANQTAEEQQVAPNNNILSASNSSSCESINSQEGLQNKKGRQEQLEQRHQELLRKQKALQEQYARLQQLQRNASGLTTVPPAPPDLLKKTGSESNLLAKMGLGLSTANSGSLTSLTSRPELSIVPAQNASTNQTTTNKIYETDIL